MRIKPSLTVFILFLFCLSCIEEASDQLPSSTSIDMEAEGGEAQVLLDGEDWKITEVINQKGLVPINGDSFSPEGKLIKENHKLSLEGFGYITAYWPDKGFVISKESPASLTIELQENATGEDFSFVVVLQSDAQVKEITVSQKKSQGYQFDRITYHLGEDDGDSLFTLKSTVYSFDIQTEQDFSFTPFSGVNVERRSYFESPQPDAFAWLENTLVKVPIVLLGQAIRYSADEELYSNNIVKSPHGFEGTMVHVTIPSGKSEVWAEVEYRRRRISYQLLLTNNRTQEQKIIEGRWVEITPTGNYTIKTER